MRTAKKTPSETEYYLDDPFGSIAMLTSSTATQTAPSSGTYQYDSYGKPIGAASSTFGSNSGQLLPTGLQHYGARYYDPAAGAWTQQDPISQMEDLTQADRYAYAADNPVNSADPSGLFHVGFSVDVGPVDIGAEVDTNLHVGVHAGIGPAEEFSGGITAGPSNIQKGVSVEASGCAVICVGGSHNLSSYSPSYFLGAGAGGGGHVNYTEEL